MRRRTSGLKSTRRVLYLLASATASLVVVGVRASEITSTWSGNSGDWTDPTQWSTNPNYPNNGTPAGVSYDALINAAGSGAYTVSLSNNITTDSVTLNSPNANLSQTGGTLTTGALNISSGTYNVSGGTAEFASFNNSGGTFSVGNTGFSSTPLILQSLSVGTTGFNNAGGTIEAGIDSGINFNLSGTVTTAQLGNIVNDGGTFLISSSAAVIDNTGTTLTFGGTVGGVGIFDTTIRNGVVDFPSDVSFQDGSLLQGVTLASDIKAVGQHMEIQGIAGAGHTINLLDNVSSFFVAPIAGNVTSATLNNVNVNMASNVGVAVHANAGMIPSTTLTVDCNSIVAGFGDVGFTPIGQTDLAVNNQGAIAANANGKTLTISPIALTNIGTLGAINGGILSIAPSYSFGSFWSNNGSLAADSLSAIDINQGLQLTSGSSLTDVLGNNGTCGLIQVSGGLVIQNSASLNLSLAPGAVFSGPYEIISFRGTPQGTFSEVTPGFVLDYSHPGEVLVTAIPEPAGFGLLFACAGLALARRHRKTIF